MKINIINTMKEKYNTIVFFFYESQADNRWLI